MKYISTGMTAAFARTAGMILCFILFTYSSYAQKASLGQQVAVMKTLKPDLKTIGVVSNNISDKMTQDLTRAGVSQGITIVIAKAKDAREVASLYKKLVSEKKIQMLWVPDASDDVVMGLGMDFLKENTAMDGVGLCVPVKALVASGALCCVQSEDGKLVAYVNKKLAAVVGATIPAEIAGISFVAQ
jgi:ABC-type uncharacterized transport system substrate-binding protein